MPLNICTRDGDDPQEATPIKFACSAANSYISRCTYGSLLECESVSCVYNTPGAGSYTMANYPADTFGYGVCTNGQATTTRNYMEIKYYRGYTDSNAGCPGTPFDATAYTGFELGGIDRLATGVCVAQDNGKYIETKCSQYGGQIGLYNDDTCTVPDTILMTYTNVCDKINLVYESGQPRWYRRFAGCYVNDANIVQPTDDPTTEPTSAPTTGIPTSLPPTMAPSTSSPTQAPSGNPSSSPTTTANPSPSPTKHPVTPRPTRNPFYYTQSPTKPPTQSPTTSIEKMVEDAGEMSLIQYGIGLLVVMYGIIACWVWCGERRKRQKILNPSAKMRKRQFAEAHKRRAMTEMQSHPHEHRPPMDKVNSVSRVEGNPNHV
eukprot:323253_1